MHVALMFSNNSVYLYPDSEISRNEKPACSHLEKVCV